MRKTVFGAVISCFLIGIPIVAVSEENQARMPTWVNEPASAFPSDSYLTAVGDGSDRNAAAAKAVNELSSVFSQNIRSAVSSSKRMEQAKIDGKVATADVRSLDQAITRNVNADDVIGIEIKEYWFDGKTTWYAVAVIDKHKVSAMYSQMIMQNNREVNTLLAVSDEEKYTFDTYARFDFAREIVLVNEGYLQRLQVLDPPSAQQLRNTSLTSKKIQQDLMELTKNISVFISISGDKDNRITGAFADAISKAGFRVSTDSKERYIINGNLSYFESKTSSGSITYCNYVLDAHLIDVAHGKEIVPFTVHGRDGAKNYDAAYRRTLVGIEKKVRIDFNKQLTDYLKQLAAE